MKCAVYFLTLFLWLSGCSNSLTEKEKLKQLEEKVLQLHDEAMEQMGALNKWQRKLQPYLLQANIGQTGANEIKNQITELKLADVAMMDWMHQYKSPDSMATEVALLYLQNQLVKMEKVKTRINLALGNAEKIEKSYVNPAKK